MTCVLCLVQCLAHSRFMASFQSSLVVRAKMLGFCNLSETVTEKPIGLCDCHKSPEGVGTTWRCLFSYKVKVTGCPETLPSPSSASAHPNAFIPQISQL